MIINNVMIACDLSMLHTLCIKYRETFLHKILENSKSNDYEFLENSEEIFHW